MRFILGLLLVSFLPIQVFSQNEFGSIQLPSRYLDNYWIVPDDAGNLCVQYYKKPNVHFIIIDKTGNQLAEIRHSFKYEPSILAGNYVNGAFQFYYVPRSRKKEGTLAAFIVDPAKDQLKDQIRYDLLTSRSEEIIGHFKDEQSLYLVISVKNGNIIRVVNLEGAPDPEMHTYSVPPPVEKIFSNPEPFLFVNPLALKSVYDYQANKKVYFNQGRIYFTFDNRQQFKTFMWEIDPRSDDSKLTNVPNADLIFGRTSNSFLHNNKLYRFTADQVKIDLSIYDLNGKDSVASFTHQGEGEISFKVGSIWFIDEYGSQQSIPQMKNDKLFKTLSNGNAAVFVERINDSNVKVTMGAFNEMASGLSIGGGFGSIGRSGGIAIGGSKQLTGTRRGSTFIHTYLRSPDFRLSKDDNLLTPNERIFRYLDKNRRSIHSSKVYDYSEETVHLSFVDPENGKLKIVEFAK